MKHFWRTTFRAVVSTTLVGGVLSVAAIAALPAAPATALTPPPCTTTWTATASGTYSWNTAGDWNHGLPGTGSVACITEPGTYTVQLIGGTTTIDALELGSGTTGDQETLDLFGTCSNNATLDTTNTADSPDFDTIASTGQLFIGSTSCGNDSTLGIGTSLDESSGGLIETDSDNGGSRAISGSITSDGTVNIAIDTTYSSGTWDNGGPLNISSGETLTFATSTPASTFTDDTGGSVSSPSSGSGQLVIDSGNTYNQGNGTTSDEPVLLAGAQSGPTIAVHYTGTGASDLVAEGQESFDGPIASGQMLEIAGTCSDNAVDTEDANVTNNGTIDVSSTGCGNNSQLTVTAGDTLTNDGTLETVEGNGGTKTIIGNVDNNGTADIDIATTYETGAWDNQGALDIANGETLTVATATPVSTFTNDTGGSVTSPSSGSGQLVIDSGNTYNQGNGTTSSEPVLLAGAQSGPTIALHYTGTGASDVVAQGQETFDGPIGSGQTLEIAGTCSDNAVDTEDANVTNKGLIDLTSTGCGNDSQLTVTSGDTLTNDGTFETVNGNGGTKTIVGNITNDGTVDIDQTATYESGTWDNKGALDISTNETLTVATATPAATFTNDTGGSITSVGSTANGELIVDDGNTVNQDDGSTSGEPVVIAATQSGPAVTLNYGGDASAGSSTIQAEGEETLTGSIQAGQSLDVAGTCSDNALTSLGSNVKDSGSILITSTGCGNNSELSAPKHTKLTIEKTGQLTTENGNGGTRTFSGNIKNKGTVTIDVNTTYTPIKKGVFTNKGTVTIASGETLNVTNVKKSVFLNAKGTITGSGQLVVNGPHDKFEQSRGKILTTPVLLDGATLDIVGTGAGTIDAEGTSTLEGNIASGQTVNVVGYCSLNAVLTGTGSMTNSGTLNLTNSSCGNETEFALPSGDTLTNSSTGLIETLPGDSPATRTIVANVTNDGTIGPSGDEVLTIDGNLTDSSTANFDVNVDTGTSDVIAMGAGDTASLGGTLTAVPVAGFTPTSGYSATIITGTHTGTFASVGPAGWSAAYGTSVTLNFS